jgi:hypothetical protein
MNHRSIVATVFASALACAALSLAGCAKPKDEDCKNAIANIRHLYGTAGYGQGTPPQAAVRSCRGSASREAVDCIIKAKTIQELESCAGGGEFLEAMKDTSAAQQAPAPTPAPTQPQQAPAPTPTQQDPAQQAPAQQDPAQPAPAQQDPAQQQQAPAPTPAPAQQPGQQPPGQQPAQQPAQQNPAENPGQPAAPGQQPPAH